MKKFLSGTILGFTLAISSLSIYATVQEYTLTKYDTPIYIDGVKYPTDALPVLSLDANGGGNTYIPLRNFSEMTGYKVDYDGANNVINITKGNLIVDSGVNNNSNANDEPVAYTENGIDFIEVNGVKYIKLHSIPFSDYSYRWWYDSNIMGIKKDGELIINNIPFIQNDSLPYLEYDYYLNNIKPLIEG